MKKVTVACNGATVRKRKDLLRLHYLDPAKDRVRIGLPAFVDNVLHLPPRQLDLIEIAAYVYSADRNVHRGGLTDVEYNSWARQFDFYIAVRDHVFWNRLDVKQALTDTLRWLTGDASYTFTFVPGHTTSPSNLFDAASESLPSATRSVTVLPFSGGLDSLAGALHVLSTTQNHVMLVSHQSQSKTKHTQDVLQEALKKLYPGRVSHYPFECHLRGERAPEETQRTRSFLYCAIASTLAMTYQTSEVQVFENGVTSLNFSRRQDQMNGRASRTTHPQTLSRLTGLMSLVAERPLTISSPFMWMTKSEVIDVVRRHAPHLLSSAVSCTATFRHREQATHCGECFQCIDRRIAAYAIGANDLDHSGLYHSDIISNSPTTPAAKTATIDYIRQALFFATSSQETMEERYLAEMAEMVGHVPGEASDLELGRKVHELLQRHGNNVKTALGKMQNDHSDVFEDLAPGCLVDVVASREYRKPEVERLAEALCSILKTAVPPMFRGNPPSNENDFNQKVGALLRSHMPEITSEHPLTRFSLAGVVTDHALPKADLVVEAKFIRKGTTPSVASEGIAGDITKYEAGLFILFVVLDLDGAIKDDRIFCRDIEARRSCKVLILR